MISGVYGSVRSLDEYMYSHISKQYYCGIHGYSYRIQISNRFIPYFGNVFDIDSNTGNPNPSSSSNSRGKMFKNTMAKVLMVIDAMYIHSGYHYQTRKFNGASGSSGFSSSSSSSGNPSADWLVFFDSDTDLNVKYLNFPL